MEYQTICQTNMSTLISKHIHEMFKDIHPSWKNVFMSKEFRPIISSCISQIGLDLEKKGVTRYDIKRNGLDTYIRPAPENIFEAFKYFDINNLRAVIVGQDPYPNLENAMGMSFSTMRETERVPKSLNIIYDCWIKQGLLNSKPDHGSLVEISKQGVLFLNRYLTRTPNIEISGSGKTYVNGDGDSKAKYMHTFWADFTDKLIEYLCTDFFEKSNVAGDRPPLPILLWGSPAGKLESVVPASAIELGRVRILKWSHPVAMISKKSSEHFENCDHFTIVNDILKSSGMHPIRWNPDVNWKHDAKDQFLTLRMLGKMSSDAKSISPGDKKMIISLLKVGKAYDDETNTAANKYIRDAKEHQRKKREAALNETPNEPTDATDAPPDEPVDEPVDEPTDATDAPPDEPVNEIEQIVVFTDGSCPGNGKANSKAGWAVWFPAEYGSFVNGIVPETEETPRHRVIYGKLPSRMLIMEPSDRSIIYARNNKSLVKCTNQRAELLAVIHAIEKILRSYKKTHTPKAVIIVPDNEYVIWWITELLWKYKAIDSSFRTVKANRDLVILLYRSLSALSKILPTSDDYEEMEEKLLGPEALGAWKAFFATKGKRTPVMPTAGWNGLTIIHQNSHLAEKGLSVPNPGTIEWERYKGNEKADEYAEMVARGGAQIDDDLARISEKIE